VKKFDIKAWLLPGASLGQSKEEWNNKLHLSDLDEEQELRSLSKWFKPCRCLPPCSSINYDAEISQSQIDIQKHLKANKAFEEEDDE
jgi:hypothetical protein